MISVTAATVGFIAGETEVDALVLPSPWNVRSSPGSRMGPVEEDSLT